MVAFVGGEGIERYKCTYLMFGYLEFSVLNTPPQVVTTRLFIVFAFSYISYVFDIPIYQSETQLSTLLLGGTATISSIILHKPLHP